MVEVARKVIGQCVTRWLDGGRNADFVALATLPDQQQAVPSATTHRSPAWSSNTVTSKLDKPVLRAKVPTRQLSAV